MASLGSRLQRCSAFIPCSSSIDVGVRGEQPFYDREVTSFGSCLQRCSRITQHATNGIDIGVRCEQPLHNLEVAACSSRLQCRQTTVLNGSSIDIGVRGE